jgi:hypothetical protein
MPGGAFKIGLEAETSRLAPGFTLPVSLAQFAWTHILTTIGHRFIHRVNVSTAGRTNPQLTHLPFFQVGKDCEMFMTECCQDCDKCETKVDSQMSGLRAPPGLVAKSLAPVSHLRRLQEHE